MKRLGEGLQNRHGLSRGDEDGPVSGLRTRLDLQHWILRDVFVRDADFVRYCKLIFPRLADVLPAKRKPQTSGKGALLESLPYLACYLRPLDSFNLEGDDLGMQTCAFNFKSGCHPFSRPAARPTLKFYQALSCPKEKS